MTRMILFSLALLLALAAVSASPALAQVRPEPQGNTLPDASPAVPPGTGIDVPADPAVAADPHAHGPARRDMDHTPAMSRDDHLRFAAQVRFDRFRGLAVMHSGRVKIIDTMAREHLERIYGKAQWRDLSAPAGDLQTRYDPVFTFLDLLFNKTYYLDKPLIHVEVLDLRRNLLSILPPDQQDAWLRIGRLTPMMLADPRARAVLQGMDADVTTLKARNQVFNAWAGFVDLGQQFTLISPAPGAEQWTGLDSLLAPRPADAATPANAVAADVLRQFTILRDAWHRADAPAVNAALDHLADLLPQVHPASYPPAWKRGVELVYNRTNKFTIGYAAYFVATIALLMAFATGRRWLTTTGVVLLMLGLFIHALGMAARGVISGRWPIHNQYESYIAISLFAVLVGAAMAVWTRKWLFGAAAAALGTCTLLLANTVPIPSRDVGQVAGILATSRILYIHVNMVLASYGLIALGFFVSLFYLAVHYTEGRSAVRFAAAGLGDLASSTDDPAAPPPRGRAALLNDLDKAQMVVLQLAFWILIVGIGLGAYWADHAWGRFWAWDPKETWALITWIIYLIVIHVRFAVRDRGLVTAWLSIAGFFVMLWTYWGVNLLLAGLHSYA